MEAEPENQFGTGSGLSHGSDPWKRLRPEHLFGLRVGQDSDWSSGKQLYSCAQFLGGDGGQLGLHLFKSEQDAVNSLPAPNVEILRVIFENENLLDASYKGMVTSLGLEPSGTNQYSIIDVACSSSNGGEVWFRDPTMEELWCLVGFIRAIKVLCFYFNLDTDKETRSGRDMKPFRTRVNVMWLAELATVVEPVTVIISHPPNQINREEKLKGHLKRQFGIEAGHGPSSGTCLLKIDGISPTFIKSLYQLLAALYNKDPWKQLRHEHHLGLHVGRYSDLSSKKQLFPCAQFIGGNGGNLGLHLFKSEQDALKVFLKMKTKLAPNILRVTFGKENLLNASNKKMVASLGLEPSGTNQYPIIDVAHGSSNGGDVKVRDPTMEELRYLIAVIKAILLVYPLSDDKDKVTSSGGNMEFKPFIRTVDVLWSGELATAMESAAVTVSHPPNQIYGEKKIKIPLKCIQPPKEKKELVECGKCEKAIPCEQSVCCGKCKSIIYCGSECKNNHWRETHRTQCHLYKSIKEKDETIRVQTTAVKLFDFNRDVDNLCQWLESMRLHKKGMWKRVCGCYSNCPFGLLPAECKRTSELWFGLGNGEYPADRPAEIFMKGNPIFLGSWSEYYDKRDLSLRSPVAAVLSHALTVYFILTNVISSKNRLIKGEEVIVHYLGPEVELDWMKSFAEISHLLNGLGIVKIYMVGPEVPENALGPVSGLGRWVRVYLNRGLYQEQIKNLPSPHLIIALNCELDSYDSWSGAIALIQSMGVPVYFTERYEILCTRAVETLRINGFHPVRALNPFRSPLQERMPPSKVPSSRNGFLIGLNG